MINTGVVLAAEGANGFWLPADIKEVFWNSTAFFIVAALLWKFARKPVAEFFSGGSGGSPVSSMHRCRHAPLPRPNATVCAQPSPAPKTKQRL